MYLVGAAHPHKIDAFRLLDDLIVREERLVTDAEVLQEILHRYSAINRPDAIQPAFDALLSLVDETFEIGLDEVEGAKRIMFGGYGLTARDAIHISVMQTHEIPEILSFGTGFDAFPGIRRLA